MYTCRKCNKALEDTDRYCYNCGAYIGEPINLEDNWETISYISDVVDDKEQNQMQEEVTVEESDANDLSIIDVTSSHYEGDQKENYRIKDFIRLLKSPVLEGYRLIDSVGSNLVLFTALIYIFVSLIISCIVKFTLPIPNDLLKIICPIGLIEKNYYIEINIPASFGKSFIYSLLGIILVSTVVFLIIHIVLRILKICVDSAKLWSSLIFPYLYYGILLMLFFIVSFISITAANILLCIGITFYIISLYNYLGLLITGNKAVIFTSAAIVLDCAVTYIYIFLYLSIR
ncbi:hypothetical protein HMPREF1982_04692 [Clostridiales bacterium oral taxon 876 str. F0540]|nr:hypothetical protein HMPREF1982_04692 [Clostridiales bacterium oral taxon 876 str. F0540]